MSRFPGRMRAALACVALMIIAGCAGPLSKVSNDAPDLFQALPAPAPAPTEVPPTNPPPGFVRKSGVSGSGVDWKLVNSYDFNESALDRSVWSPYNSIGGFGNGFRRPSAISVKDGNLVITARGNISGGMGHELDQRYGRWEFRARTEPGRGYSSAILLWPQSESKELDGEIDMMEVPREQRDAAHFVLHWGKENTIHGGRVDADFTQWHTFAMEWLPNRVTWYVDGVKQYENTNKAAIPQNPMHLTIQLDMGPLKDWLPPLDETTPPAVSLYVDWIKIYRRP